jgi:hypothetical protein
MSLKGSRARSRAHKEQLVREAQTENMLDSLNLPKSAGTDRVLDTLHVPHVNHGKPGPTQPHIWWEKNKSKVSVGCLIVAMVAAMTLGILVQNQ